jgi:cytidylate kinase
LGLLTDPASLQLQLFKDDNGLSYCEYKHDYAKVQFIHGAAGAPAVDVYVNDQLVFANVAYTQATKYVSQFATTVSIRVTVAGTQTTVVGPLNLALQPRQVYTIVASGIVGSLDTPLTAVVLTSHAKKEC